MAKRIIKPDSGNTLVLQEDNGSVDALTVETNGDVTLGGNLVIPDSGTIGSQSDTDAITIDASGNVTLGGNLVIPDSGTIGSQSDTDAITIDASGNVTLAEKLIIDPAKGIQFRTSTGGSGTSFDSGILDDYEEGTWTPVPENNDASDLSNNDSVGWYRKIGKLVWVQGWVKFSGAPGGAANDCRISEFPFSNIATNSGPLIPLRFSGTRPSSLAQYGVYWGYLYTSTNQFFKIFYETGGTLYNVKGSDLASDSNIFFSFTYSNG